MLIDKKFKDSDFAGKNVKSLPDRPSEAGITTADLKAMFDNVSETIIAKGRINEIIDVIVGVDGASNIGTTDGTNVQTQLDNGVSDITAHTENNIIHVNESRILTKDNTEAFTPTGKYQPATKAYVDNKVVEIGAADMQQMIYDPNGKAQDIFAYTDTAISAKADKSTVYNIIAIPSGWVDMKQVITVNGLLSTDKGVIGLSSNAPYEQAAKAQLSFEQTSDDSITIIVNGDTPTVDMPITILKVG